jgi:hypothetical protein
MTEPGAPMMGGEDGSGSAGGSGSDDGSGSAPQEPRRTRGGWRDFWQLHVPLVLVLTLCTVITIIEVRRASEGVWRAWAYMVEWPLIGLFTIWIWHRYRTEGSVTKGLAARWRDRVARLSAESDEVTQKPDQEPDQEPDQQSDQTPGRTAAEPPARSVQAHGSAEPAAHATAPHVDDPELDAWTAYVTDLRRREPPGSPPSTG